MSFIVIALAAPAVQGGSDWKQYTDSGRRFLIAYPSTAHPETLGENEPGLVSRIVFDFDQPFSFRFQVSIWENPTKLNGESWAKHRINERLPATVHVAQIAGRTGAILRTTNLAWPIVKAFVPDRSLMYELSYTDFTSRLPESAGARWTAIFNKMIRSFRILSNDQDPAASEKEHRK